ncbi:3-deoxy-7-phosphoheptulonate synthase [Nocardioides panaciterrulae]|uniref:3-deoxy-7-phosphoheptulonate synthase n=1 Tax=Nocardioides panaciterrulae TaxID=661492 RepID=A0A7Y9E5G8_9ACTN|nr:3-deoxy-7-phosphoheptulonate synthase [Nocardioides panaciterrulae]
MTSFPDPDGVVPLLRRGTVMVVVMAPGATPEDVARVVARVEAAGGETFVSTGVSRTIIGLVGDVDAFWQLDLRALPGVAAVHRISDPYKLVSRQHHPERSTVWVGSGERRVPLGPGRFTLIAGPCAVESAEQALEAAHIARSAGASLLRAGAWKQRTSPYAFPGLGVTGLEILARAGEATGMPVVTEVVDPRDVPVAAEHADMLQVGSASMASVGLLQAVAETGRPVLLERGHTATVEEWLMAAEHIAQRGNLDIVLCERGIRTFEPTTRTTPDLVAVPVAQAASHLPVVVDPSHAAGRRDLVVPLARAAIAVGADGVAVDVHPHPEDALCHGPQALHGAELRELARAVRRLPAALGRQDTPAAYPRS